MARDFRVGVGVDTGGAETSVRSFAARWKEAEGSVKTFAEKFDSALSSIAAGAARNFKSVNDQIDNILGWASKIGRVVGAFKEFIDLGDRFGDMQEGMVGSIDEAQRAIAGQASAMELMSFKNRLVTEEFSITERGFRNLTVGAKVLSDRLGIDLSTAMEQMTSAIQTGRVQGLRRLMPDLELTGTLAEKQEQILAALERRYSGVTVAASSLSDKLAVAKSAIADMVGGFAKAVNESENLNLALGRVTDALTKTKEAEQKLDAQERANTYWEQRRSEVERHNAGVKEMIRLLEIDRDVALQMGQDVAAIESQIREQRMRAQQMLSPGEARAELERAGKPAAKGVAPEEERKRALERMEIEGEIAAEAAARRAARRRSDAIDASRENERLLRDQLAPIELANEMERLRTTFLRGEAEERQRVREEEAEIDRALRLRAIDEETEDYEASLERSRRFHIALAAEREESEEARAEKAFARRMDRLGEESRALEQLSTAWDITRSAMGEYLVLAAMGEDSSSVLRGLAAQFKARAIWNAAMALESVGIGLWSLSPFGNPAQAAPAFAAAAKFAAAAVAFGGGSAVVGALAGDAQRRPAQGGAGAGASRAARPESASSMARRESGGPTNIVVNMTGVIAANRAELGAEFVRGLRAAANAGRAGTITVNGTRVLTLGSGG